MTPQEFNVSNNLSLFACCLCEITTIQTEELVAHQEFTAHFSSMKSAIQIHQQMTQWERE